MKPSTEVDYQERITRTLAHIEQHLNDDIDLDQLADVAAFSRFHFHRIFRAFVGEPLHAYVRRLRLERAARELRAVDSSVTDIAAKAGFGSHEAFTRAFGDMFGRSPSAYRAAHHSQQLSEDSPVHASSHPRRHSVTVPSMEIVTLPMMHLVFIRHVGPYDQVSGTWARLFAWLGAHGMLGPDTRSIGIAHDDPDVTPGDRVRYDAAATVPEPARAEGEVGTMVLPASRYAVARHQGPYSELPDVYHHVYRGWLPASVFTLRDAPALEHYLNSPETTNPKDLLTLVQIPLDGP